MTIVTKFEIGDKPFRMKDNKIIQDEIYEIVVRVKKTDTKHIVEFTYILKVGGGQSSDNLFPTKEDLLKSL